MISSVALQNFRNYRFFEFTPSKLNVVTGPNGSGKTNFLEAISFLGHANGFRGTPLKEASLEELGNFEILLTTEWGPIDKRHTYPTYTKEVAIRHDGMSKNIFIDFQPIKQKELLKLFKVLYLLPQDEFILTSGVRERRSFFDRIVTFYDNEHANFLKRYKLLASERIKILQSGTNDETWLSGVESEIASASSVITSNRVVVFEWVSAFMQSRTDAFKGDIKLVNAPENWIIENDLKSIEYESRYRDQLKSCREKDRALGKTTFGVGKFDFEAFKCNPKTEKLTPHRLLSAGEQKMTLISMVLACIHRLSTSPSFKITQLLLLIDEICAKLDPQNQKALFEELSQLECQIFLTGMFERAILQEALQEGQYKILDVSSVNPSRGFGSIP